MPIRITRRATLLGALTAPVVLRHGLAQSAPIKFGTLTPLTGAGGAYGPLMVKSVKAVVDEINAAGGLLGRQIVLITEDDETNPDAGVRAARKLIDVDKVNAVIGTWASAVTTAVAPLCWESKTMLFTVSGGDGITRLPHLGFIIRTQPDSKLQATRSSGFMLKQGAKKVVVLAAQTPFAASTYETQAAVLKAGGAEPLANIIYDAAKTSFRSEVDQALKFKPDTLFLNSYQPDLQVLLRDLFRAGFEGKKYTLAYAANDKLLASLPPEVTEGLVHYAPSPDLGSPGYAAVKLAIGAEPDPYSSQTHDHISLAVLAMARAKAATSQAIHDNVRAIGNKDGVKVGSATEGLKALAAGKEINYEGASGPCKFTDIGDIFDCKFRFDVVEKGKSRLLELS
jgi:branched-chain amino acid transport system substrate-binding protein